MTAQTFIIRGACGLHARPALRFVDLAKKFESKIIIEKENKRIDAKSVVSVLSAGISDGTTIHLSAEGPDEEEAMCQISEFLSIPLD